MLGVVQVCMHTCAELIASVPFLEDAEDGFVRYLVTQLHPTVCCRVCDWLRVSLLSPDTTDTFEQRHAVILQYAMPYAAYSCM